MSWYAYQDVPQLEHELNTAVDQLGLHSSFNTLEGRMTNLNENGTVYNYLSCACTPDISFDAFNPPPGTVCSWSCILSLLTGWVEPRASLDVFNAFSLRCHTPNMVHEESDIFVAFTNITKVVSILGKYSVFSSCTSFLDKS